MVGQASRTAPPHPRTAPARRGWDAPPHPVRPRRARPYGSMPRPYPARPPPSSRRRNGGRTSPRIPLSPSLPSSDPAEHLRRYTVPPRPSSCPSNHVPSASRKPSRPASPSRDTLYVPIRAGPGSGRSPPLPWSPLPAPVRPDPPARDPPPVSRTRTGCTAPSRAWNTSPPQDAECDRYRSDPSFPTQNAGCWSDTRSSPSPRTQVLPPRTRPCR